MFAIDLPNNYDPYKFLPWLSRTYGRPEARWWGSKLSPKAWSKTWELKAALQVRFQALYDEYAMEQKMDITEIWYAHQMRPIECEQLAIENKARREVYARTHFIRPKRLYKVVYEEEAHEGCFKLAAELTEIADELLAGRIADWQKWVDKHRQNDGEAFRMLQLYIFTCTETPDKVNEFIEWRRRSSIETTEQLKKLGINPY